MKRFIDDRIWLDSWFGKLDIYEKMLWIYLFTNCSKIGIWEENIDEVEFRLKKKLDWGKVKQDFSDKIQFIGTKWHIKKFIELQYPNLLKYPESPLHVSVFKELEKNCLKLIENSLSIDYQYPIDSLQVIVKVKEEEKKRKGKEEEKEVSPLDIALKRFSDHRRAIKRPLTKHGEKLILDRLYKLSSNIDDQIKILDQSIVQGWRGVFPLLEKSDKQQSRESLRPFPKYQREVSDESIENILKMDLQK